MNLRFRVLPHAADLPLPRYETEQAAGLDLRAAIAAPLTIEPRGSLTVPTGLVFEIPPGFEGQVRGRSGLAFKSSVTTHVGTIDADYRGELSVRLFNLGTEPFVVNPGDRVSQIIFAPVAHVDLVLVESLTETERGAGGFGSTGRS